MCRGLSLRHLFSLANCQFKAAEVDIPGLKQACSPFPFHFTSITPNRGDQQRLNYVMLGLDLRPEMLPSQLPKCRFVINNFNYSTIANSFSIERLEIFSH